MARRIIVVGGGASGLMAAITAARKGAEVTVLEQNDRPGKKLGATGNGRCNLTNLQRPKDAYRGSDPCFAREALHRFSVQDTIRFFSELGIYTINKRDWIYPRSGEASSVTEVLLMEASRLGVVIKTREKAVSVKREENCWQVLTEGWSYQGDCVILAGGSRASSISGADGSCYDLAEQLGHRLIPVLPALTALRCREGSFASWGGVRTEGEVTLHVQEEEARRAAGELQLTEYGISGIPIFQLSRYAIQAIHREKEARLTVDFLPEFSQDGLKALLNARRRNCPYKNDRELLVGLFPEKLSKVLRREKDLIPAIKAYPLQVTGGMSFAQAQVCQGGVDTSQVWPETMESRLHPGLYFAGELLDVDGTCGGYNLQWAWSSGATAGRSAAAERKM
ncbi:MAG: NAD(P)/FAD-dependent oxidoreductase [Eubacteriales bacterium]|nr:NAD(P)/FAD-dependent oxidoreductase [Eubacteriales bacterium]